MFPQYLFKIRIGFDFVAELLTDLSIGTDDSGGVGNDDSNVLLVAQFFDGLSKTVIAFTLVELQNHSVVKDDGRVVSASSLRTLIVFKEVAWMMGKKKSFWMLDKVCPLSDFLTFSSSHFHIPYHPFSRYLFTLLSTGCWPM